MRPEWNLYLSLSVIIIVLNLNLSFNFCARLGFNVIWFVKFMKIKLKIEIISIQHNSFIDSIHCWVSPLSYIGSTKAISLELRWGHLGFLERAESLKRGGHLEKGDMTPLSTMEILSAVVIKNYRNQGQRPRNREKDIGSQHCGKMVLNIITL